MLGFRFCQNPWTLSTGWVAHATYGVAQSPSRSSSRYWRWFLTIQLYSEYIPWVRSRLGPGSSSRGLKSLSLRRINCVFVSRVGSPSFHGHFAPQQDRMEAMEETLICIHNYTYIHIYIYILYIIHYIYNAPYSIWSTRTRIKPTRVWNLAGGFTSPRTSSIATRPRFRAWHPKPWTQYQPNVSGGICIILGGWEGDKKIQLPIENIDHVTYWMWSIYGPLST